MRISTFITFTLLVIMPPASAWAQNAEVKASRPAITRIAFLGDSITAGVGVKDKAKERYATVATRLLAGTQSAITEINLGQSGRALCQQNASYPESVLKQNPDAVVIQWGVNDQYWGFSIAEFTARYNALVAALRNAKPQMPIVVMTLIADFRRAENQDVWIGEANIALQEIAARYRCHLADTHRSFDHRKELYADSIHPNTAGAEVMAKTIVAALDALPRSAENAAISFDQGTEVRFLQNVFLPKREGAKPDWVDVMGISSKGMNIESKIPIAIRTAPIYPKGSYRIVIHDKNDAVVDTVTSTSDFSRTHSFVFDPKGHDGPFRVEIAPESQPHSPPGIK
ncbi:MAG: SGNH/GDSL hydrolase family protein [Proteobacteria bacterium]|nr:SGNH/GDSL hydrolase family protein [Pseudomonadota bacterium]